MVNDLAAVLLRLPGMPGAEQAGPRRADVLVVVHRWWIDRSARREGSRTRVRPEPLPAGDAR
ncbi:hypothetical protein ACL03H_06560 [Saccharopolyspora sp. MS10]|uniref:hypothetical protein n=1 Tax=Saccharopolyspora sp. MS10 TaxID=3385973 RepID=UPI0039A2DCAF